jgi:hypothetical protein
VPIDVTKRLEDELHRELGRRKEEPLVSVIVSALEDFRTPARIVALTHHALLVIDQQNCEHGNDRRHAVNDSALVQRYELATISSVQLRHSLMGSSLSLFIPLPNSRTRQVVIPFHSPAVAWFFPLFTRLRVLLSNPYRLREQNVVVAKEK